MVWGSDNLIVKQLSCTSILCIEFFVVVFFSGGGGGEDFLGKGHKCSI